MFSIMNQHQADTVVGKDTRDPPAKRSRKKESTASKRDRRGEPEKKKQKTSAPQLPSQEDFENAAEGLIRDLQPLGGRAVQEPDSYGVEDLGFDMSMVGAEDAIDGLTSNARVDELDEICKDLLKDSLPSSLPDLGCDVDVSAACGTSSAEAPIACGTSIAEAPAACGTSIAEAPALGAPEKPSYADHLARFIERDGQLWKNADDGKKLSPSQICYRVESSLSHSLTSDEKGTLQWYIDIGCTSPYLIIYKLRVARLQRRLAMCVPTTIPEKWEDFQSFAEGLVRGMQPDACIEDPASIGQHIPASKQPSIGQHIPTSKQPTPAETLDAALDAAVAEAIAGMPLSPPPLSAGAKKTRVRKAPANRRVTKKSDPNQLRKYGQIVELETDPTKAAAACIAEQKEERRARPLPTSYVDLNYVIEKPISPWYGRNIRVSECWFARVESWEGYSDNITRAKGDDEGQSRRDCLVIYNDFRRATIPISAGWQLITALHHLMGDRDFKNPERERY